MSDNMRWLVLVLAVMAGLAFAMTAVELTDRPAPTIAPSEVSRC